MKYGEGRQTFRLDPPDFAAIAWSIEKAACRVPALRDRGVDQRLGTSKQPGGSGHPERSAGVEEQMRDFDIMTVRAMAGNGRGVELRQAVNAARLAPPLRREQLEQLLDAPAERDIRPQTVERNESLEQVEVGIRRLIVAGRVSSEEA
jgi:hypothetical protein